MPSADAWAVEAAGLPLAFAQVREDPRLDLAMDRMLPEQATIVMIASGGDTLVELARLPLKRIHAVDVNPAQLVLAKLKCFLAETTNADDSARLLGHDWMEPAVREARMKVAMERLGFPSDLLGPVPEMADAGADHLGRYERCFAELRRNLPPWDRAFPLAELDAALARVMSLKNLAALFGVGATQNPRIPFHKHFAERTRMALTRDSAAVNPFLRQMYAGTFFTGNRYDWLESSAPLRAERVWHCGAMAQVLEGMDAASVDLVHLSNILDWLSPAGATSTLESMARVLKPGGRIMVRQLNSSLEMDCLTPLIQWDHGLGRALERQDRSFFYPNIFTGCRV